MGSRVDHIRSYYEALNTGDAEAVARHFTDDATHYYTRLGPHEGAETIGQMTDLAVESIEASGTSRTRSKVMAGRSGDRVVDDLARPEGGEKRLDRGTEWFVFRDGLIAEVRAYHHGGPKNPSGDLLGFDHEGRGYTMLEEQ